MHGLEKRLALLEERIAMLESKKPASKHAPVEELLSDLGLVYLLSHAHNRLAYEPSFTGYDQFLEDIFKCTITGNNRTEYAYKLKEIMDNILDKAADRYFKSKMSVY